jgi:hypothetical protein
MANRLIGSAFHRGRFFCYTDEIGCFFREVLLIDGQGTASLGLSQLKLDFQNSRLSFE